MNTGTLTEMIEARQSNPCAPNLEQAQAVARETYLTVVQILDSPQFPAWLFISLPHILLPEEQTTESLHIWWGCFKVWMDGIKRFAPSLWVKLNTARIQWP